MTTKKKAANKATDPIAPALAVGEQLLAGFRQELTDLKNPGNAKQNVWQMLSEAKQDELLDRFGRRIGHHFRIAFEAILAGGVPAVHAKLAKVAFSDKKILGGLEIPRNSEHRHELSDFAGAQVLVILTEKLDEYLDSMAAVKPDKDQAELELDEGVDDDPRTLEELRVVAAGMATELGEEDVADLIPEWDREKVLEYMEFAKKKAINGD